MGLLACLAGWASPESDLESQRLDARVLRSRPEHSGADEVVRVSRADLLAQKHSCEVLSSQLVKADVSMLPIAVLWGMLGFVWAV
jgi:hypothetical protein